MAVRKWSVSVDEELAERVVRHIGPRGLSRFVSTAIEHELERVALGDHLAELDSDLGPVPPELIEEFDGLWPS